MWHILVAVICFTASIAITSCQNKVATDHNINDNKHSEIDEGDILWQTSSIGENLEATPAIDDSGNVYTIADGTLYSYSSKGSKRWSRTISPGDANSPSINPDNSIVYASGNEGVYAINASTGTLIWHNSSFSAGFHTVPAISADGSRIYIGSGAERDPSDSFFAIDASDGSIAWTYILNEDDAEGIRGFMGGAVFDSAGILYVSSQHGWLISLTDNGTSYTENWKFNFNGEARQPVTIGADGYIYTSSNTGKVHKINPSTGIEVSSDYWPALGNIGEVFTSLCLGADSTIYVNAEDYKLHALNPDGSEKWSITFEGWGSDPLVRDDGMIIVMGQIEGAGRVCGIKDNGNSSTIEWYSPKILENLTLNETNVNISANGTIYVHSGDQSPLALFAIEGNGYGLNTSSPWPKYMGNIQNNGNR